MSLELFVALAVTKDALGAHGELPGSRCSVPCARSLCPSSWQVEPLVTGKDEASRALLL
jgi:hypothetical protein